MHYNRAAALADVASAAAARVRKLRKRMMWVLVDESKKVVVGPVARARAGVGLSCGDGTKRAMAFLPFTSSLWLWLGLWLLLWLLWIAVLLVAVDVIAGVISVRFNKGSD